MTERRKMVWLIQSYGTGRSAYYPGYLTEDRTWSKHVDRAWQFQFKLVADHVLRKLPRERNRRNVSVIPYVPGLPLSPHMEEPPKST